MSRGQLLDEPLDARRRILDLAQEPHLASASSLGNRHRVLRLGNIKRDKNCAIFSHGPPSVHEARLGPPEQPSFLLHDRAGHRLQPGNMTSIKSRAASGCRACFGMKAILEVNSV